ncbi:FkbM family methyltransferase [Vreelandella venusta]|uniref:Methyltransferase FkbM domain-containing protein n=1 Tax=Vreelandella venusta TaxID=44935 RepID=A0ABX2B9C1_9GAMM|nr:FkbM family methyltransferase [Halomonas venusta]AZM96622.1 FkbM family methyltransferase [Halomonas venusta]NPT30058.1 hypothetical protein [Halomonas venusta]UQI39360.1 FkbM family methyltransferase [Halomonas venusta]
MNFFLWSDASGDRYKMTLKQEPLQPFLFLSFLEFAQAEAVLDIGANVGVYSLLSTLSDSVEKVYAFEPDNDAYEQLKKNALLNSLSDKLIASNSPVSDKIGVLRFGTHLPMSGVNSVVDSSIHNPKIFKDTKDVKSVTIDSLTSLKGKVLGLKVDVEGHELNVIRGAKEVLLSSPAFIQIEHYAGDNIDHELEELGYFRFFVAGHDHYFTNISNFASPLFVKSSLEYASACLIESQLERWPVNKTIKSALTLDYEISGNLVKVWSKKNDKFFTDDVEYAFYLMEDGKKTDEAWYSSDGVASFAVNEDAEKVEIKGFVRERSMPEKKIAVGVFVKHPVVGYRPESAVKNSLGLPSKHAAVFNWLYDLSLGSEDVEISLLGYAAKFENFVQIGGGANFINILKGKGVEFGKEYVVSRYNRFGLSAELENEFSECINDKKIEKYSAKSSQCLESACVDLIKKIKTPALVLLRGQFLADIEADVSSLWVLFEGLPLGSILYAEKLSNISYRNALHDMAIKNDIEIKWLPPASNILTRNRQENYLKKLSIANAMSADFFDAASSLSRQGMHPEKALGLDFSLPEERR